MTAQLELFLDSIKSPRTKDSYERYIKFYGLDKLSHDPLTAQANLITFIIKCKKKGMSYSAIHNYISAVKRYYKINDIVLNVFKIHQFMPEQVRTRQDKAYTHADIGKLLEVADLRMKSVILILASSGCRIGAIPDLKLIHLQDTKLTIYENSREEYYTFITPECKHAVDSYLDMRARYGEKLGDNSPLIREEFNIRNPSKAKFMKRAGLLFLLGVVVKKAGVGSGVKLAHGFRKFFTTQCIAAGIRPESRELLLGHKIGLTGAYYRPSDLEMYADYEKAIDNLTINQEHRLKRVVTQQNTIIDEKFKELESLLRKVKEKEASLKHA